MNKYKGIREVAGKWHYRFVVHGQEYTGNTGLAATERNAMKALTRAAKARQQVLEGGAESLRIQQRPFNKAAEQFLAWADGEYREHPNSAKRIRTSFASLAEFFKGRTVASITPGAIEDYKVMRRVQHKVREVTLRHDLHALSVFYRYAMKHHWALRSPVKEVEIPSGEDAVRIHVVTEAEEKAYFAAAAKADSALHDLARLMLLQGCRPDELMSLQQQAVDLEAGRFTVVWGKSRAARRTLLLMAESREIMARRMDGGKWIFPSPRVPGAHIVKLNGSHNLACEKAGVKGVVLYDFRHTFATRAAAKGMPLATLARILGHSNLRSVLKYVHPDQADMDAGMRMLAVAE